MLKLDWKNKFNNPPSPTPQKRSLLLPDALMDGVFSSNGQRLRDARINELHNLVDFIFNQNAPLPLAKKL